MPQKIIRPNFSTLPKTLYDAIFLDLENICPEPKLIFKAFEETDLDNVKVVILGQDPYHTPGKARGVAFGYHPEYVGKLDSSLFNIIMECFRDTGHFSSVDLEVRGFDGETIRQLDTTLGSWTKQGVLLLNTRLTVLAGKPMSHSGLGWEDIITTFLQDLDKNVSGKVYMLWGKEAQSFEKHLDSENNLILKTSHPCRYSSKKGFQGCSHFSKANDYLRKLGKGEIKW